MGICESRPRPDLIDTNIPTGDYNRNDLHWACIHKESSHIIRLMLDKSKGAPLEKDGHGHTPLYYAIQHSSEDIIIMLIETCPWAASIIDIDGLTPLHQAIQFSRLSNVIFHLLAAYPAAATVTDREGETPLDIFFEKWYAPLRNSLIASNSEENEFKNVIPGYEVTIIEIYRILLLLLQAATHGSIEDNHESPFRPLHSSLMNPRWSWWMVRLILKMDPKEAYQWDREKNLPIHIAAAATSFAVDKTMSVIKHLLSTDKTFATIPDGKGRLPLHIAIDNEKTFEEGLEPLLRAAPKGVNTRDVKTHMHPFLLAAVKHDRAGNKLQKFTSCFTLLMENPYFVSYGIPH